MPLSRLIATTHDDKAFCELLHLIDDVDRIEVARPPSVDVEDLGSILHDTTEVDWEIVWT